MALNEKQKNFYKEYLVDSNATQAAVRAGYSKKTAYSQGQRLLKHVEGQIYMKELMKEKEDALIADQDEVLKYLTSVLRGESRASVVVVESTGDFMSEARELQKAPDEKERLKAAELLGKRYSLFTDKVQQEVDMDLTITVDYGDEEDED
ncbi:terminase small subunit [Anaerotignum sp.]